MNVKSKLKARTVRFVGVDKSRNPDNVTVRVQKDIDVDNEEYNFKTELFNIFLVSVAFFLLFSGYNTLSQLSVRTRNQRTYFNVRVFSDTSL